jgi:hypothetical protein
MTAPNQHEPPQAVYLRHSAAAEQFIGQAAKQLHNNPAWQLEAAKVAAILALAAALRSSGPR